MVQWLVILGIAAAAFGLLMGAFFLKEKRSAPDRAGGGCGHSAGSGRCACSGAADRIQPSLRESVGDETQYSAAGCRKNKPDSKP